MTHEDITRYNQYLKDYKTNYNKVNIINEQYVDHIVEDFKNRIDIEGILYDLPSTYIEREKLFYKVNKLILIKNTFIDKLCKSPILINQNRLKELLRIPNVETFVNKGFTTINQMVEYVRVKL